MLEERRREIQEKLRSLRETLPAEAARASGTPRSRASTTSSQEVDFALMQMKSETLAKIDEAIRRLEAGGYGDCAECGAEIAEARLKALPFAALCRDCQESEESEAAGLARGAAPEPRRARSRRCVREGRGESSTMSDPRRSPDFESGGVHGREPRGRAAGAGHPAAPGHHPLPPRHPAAGGGAGELGRARARRRPRAQGHRRRHPARPRGGRPGGERPLPDRHAHPHPQDVQVPRRLAAPGRAGRAALPPGAGHTSTGRS